jgi:hypothetical protein
MTHPYILPSTNSLEYLLEPLAFKRGCDQGTNPSSYSSYRTRGATPAPAAPRSW